MKNRNDLIKAFHDCCKTVLDEPKSSGNLPYAKAYAEAGLQMGEVGMGYPGADPMHDIEVQILYILSNLQYWRGGVAKSTKATLKDIRIQIKKGLSKP